MIEDNAGPDAGLAAFIPEQPGEAIVAFNHAAVVDTGAVQAHLRVRKQVAILLLARLDRLLGTDEIGDIERVHHQLVRVHPGAPDAAPARVPAPRYDGIDAVRRVVGIAIVKPVGDHGLPDLGVGHHAIDDLREVPEVRRGVSEDALNSGTGVPQDAVPPDHGDAVAAVTNGQRVQPRRLGHRPVADILAVEKRAKPDKNARDRKMDQDEEIAPPGQSAGREKVFDEKLIAEHGAR